MDTKCNRNYGIPKQIRVGVLRTQGKFDSTYNSISHLNEEWGE